MSFPESPTHRHTRADVAIVIPCYNEAHRLDRAAFRSYLSSGVLTRLLFVDDGSSDGTIEVLREVCGGFETKASILRCAKNAGKGEAVRLGLLHAIRQPNTSLAGFWDADLATPLAAIDRFVEVFDEKPQVAMVFGSRVKLLGRDVRRNPFRHYLGRVFATAASIVLELPIYDTQCGAKLFRVDSALPRILARPFLSKWVFDVEIIARYRKAYGIDPKSLERVIYEYPLESWHDITGSKVRPADFAAALLDLLKIRANYR